MNNIKLPLYIEVIDEEEFNLFMGVLGVIRYDKQIKIRCAGLESEVECVEVKDER